MGTFKRSLHTNYAGSAMLAAQCRAKVFDLAPDLAILVTADPDHIGYLTGYRSILRDVARFQQVAIVTRDSAVLVTGASDAAAALETLATPDDIYRYGRFFVSESGKLPGYSHLPSASETLEAALSMALARFTETSGTVGLDLSSASQLTVVVHQALNSSNFIDAKPLLIEARATKLPGEIALLRRVSAATDNAIEKALAGLVHGVTELDLAAEITRLIVGEGGITRFVVVTSGERSSRVDAYASGRAIQNGDLVRLDIGATIDGYFSDMARTVVCGTPDFLQSSRYRSLLEGQTRALEMIKPGVRASEVFGVAMRTVRSGALPDYQRNHVGHGIGLNAHEFPSLAENVDVPLQAGMVLCVETPYYEIGWGGMMVEDTILVTGDGFELLTRSSRALTSV